MIEMLIVMAIVAILARVAIPTYRDYVIRGKFPEATGELALRRVQMEQFYLDNRTFVGSSVNKTSICPPMTDPDTTRSRYFDFSCREDPTATTYTLQAVGKGDMANFTFTLDQNNVRTTGSVPAGWSKPSPNNCWVTRKAGTC